MEQRYEGNPTANLHLNGRRVTRSVVTNDWGLRLQWEVRRNGQVIATPSARPDLMFEFADTSPGTYEIVLQMWKYVDFRKKADGEFVNSRFINVSNKVTYVI